ncbi:plasmid mobilization relaxosome protein MobC [Dyadobacter sp. CY107]|uniref:plasmid mobilization protein n=1 Tax=Dyadobacter fanqingshengii TaxID=2906443 RepID=UPI001F396EDD|nr:plasmid mobilization relaxosome protein MobC [Dyadobacter fanqingshengii]MCF2502194.1 plasmid mobilization relaxosome protein MobC [Dyadobacter fanqingshengii]
MNEDKHNRTKWLHVRLTPEEFQQLLRKIQRTTCRKTSEYARKILLSEPIVVNHRNQSLDETMIELTRLRRELTAAGNNLNQAVKRLHALSQIADFRSWLDAYENDKNQFLELVKEINIYISKASKIWLRS